MAEADADADAIGEDDAEFAFDTLLHGVDKESGVKFSGDVI